MAKENSNMALKVIIALVVIIVLVFLFKGTKKEEMATPPAGQQGTGQPGADQTAPGQTTTEPVKPATKPAEMVRTTGHTLIENIFCDYSDTVVTFTLTNTMDKNLKLYQGEANVLTPETPAYNTVRIGVNGRWPNPNWDRILDCGGKVQLAPGESMTCTYKNAVLRSIDQVDKITGMGGQNVLNAVNLIRAYQNYNDLDYFTCQA